MSEHVRVGTDPVNAQSLPFEVLNAGNLLFADDVPGHSDLALTDHHQSFGASHDGPRRRKSADDPHICFSAEHRRCADGTGGDKDELDVEALLLEETGFLGNPHG